MNEIVVFFCPKFWWTNTSNFHKMLCALKRSYHSVFIYPDGYFDVFFEYILSLKSSDFPGLPNDIWLLSVVEKSTKKIYIFARIFVWNYWFFFVSKVPQNLTNKHFKIPHSFMCTETELSFGIFNIQTVISTSSLSRLSLIPSVFSGLPSDISLLSAMNKFNFYWMKL